MIFCAYKVLGLEETVILCDFLQFWAILIFLLSQIELSMCILYHINKVHDSEILSKKNRVQKAALQLAKRGCSGSGYVPVPGLPLYSSTQNFL